MRKWIYLKYPFNREKTVNEILIKISGRSAIPGRLEIGQDVQVVIIGSVVTEQKRDNQDGTYDLVYQIKPTSSEIKSNQQEMREARY